MTDRMTLMRRTSHRYTAAFLLVAAALAACSSSGSDADPEVTAISAPTTAPPDGQSADASTAPTGTAATREAPTGETTAPPQDRCAPNTGDNTTEPITLRIWHGFDGDVVGFFEDVIDAYEVEHPNVTVEVTSFEGSYSDGLEKLAALDPDERPDVFMGSNSSVRLQYDSGIFVAPSECTGAATPEALEDLLPVIERTYTVDGTLQAAPYNVSTPVMMYDRNRWQAAGLDPADPPATFDELEVVVRRLRDSGATSTGMVLYDRSASWLVEQTAAQEDRLLAEPANGRAGTAISDVVFDDPSAVAAVERFRVLKREGYVFWAGINQSGRDDLLRLADPDEPSGLTLHTSASIGDVLRIIDSGAIGVGVDVGAAPLPGNAPGGLVGGGAWWLLAHDDPARVGAAWSLVDWLIQPDRVAELAAFTGYVPTTERAAASPVTTASWAEVPALRVGYDQLAAMPATDAAAGLQVGPMVEVERALEVAASVAIDADQDPGEQLRAAEDTARTALDVYDSVYGTG